MKKYNLLLPIAGKAQRFIDAGYTMPKPLILAKDKHVINWALESVNLSECNLIFIVRVDHIYNFSIDKILKQIETTGNQIMVFNKIDRIDKASLNQLIDKYPNAIFISSLKKTGLQKLIERIAIEIYGEDANGEFKIKPSNLEIVSKYGKILNVKNESDYLIIQLNMREKLMNNLCINKVMEDINNA